MATYQLTQSHFQSSYKAPLLLEEGEHLKLGPGQWPSPDWLPVDADGKAKLAAQKAYTAALGEAREPIKDPADFVARQISERKATKCATRCRRLVYEALLTHKDFPQDASTKEAIAALEKAKADPAKGGRRDGEIEGQLAELAQEIADEAVESFFDEERLALEQGPAEADPMTSRPRLRPEGEAPSDFDEDLDEETAAAPRPPVVRRPRRGKAAQQPARASDEDI